MPVNYVYFFVILQKNYEGYVLAAFLVLDFVQALTSLRDNIDLPSPRDVFRVSSAYLHWYSPAGWQGMGTHNSTLFGNSPPYSLLTFTPPPLPHLSII